MAGTARRGRSRGRSPDSTERGKCSGARPSSTVERKAASRLHRLGSGIARSRSLPIGDDSPRGQAKGVRAYVPNSEATPQAGYGSSTSTRSSTITAVSQATTPNYAPILSSAKDVSEEYLEGGVELLPLKVESSDDLLRSTTQPLSVLDADALQQFWPTDRELPKAIFLDYDGTLREFETRPELAVPTAELMSLLEAFNERPDIRCHIISGRDSSFLDTHLGGLKNFTLIAEHGYHISPPTDGQRKWELWEHFGGDVRNFEVHRNWKSTVRDAVAAMVAEIPGSSIEEKQSSVVWHFREMVDEDTEASAQQVWAYLSQLCEQKQLKDVNISRGNKYLEVSYRTVRKGMVLRRLCEEKALFGEPFAAVLAAGDDVSDETMFEFEAAPPDFLTVKVGDGQTLASFWADSPQELREFLARLLSCS